MAPALSITNLTVHLAGNPVLININATIPQGILIAIAGPNGAGKSTLLKSCIDLIAPTTGSIQILGDSFEKNRLHIGYIPQRSQIDWDFPASVRDVVLMGRYGHLRFLQQLSSKDYDIAQHAMELVDIAQYADQHIGILSGGQQQRVLIARALAQEAQLYLMDEPFVGIDIPTEQSLFALLKTLTHSGKTVVVVHHDILSLADFDWVWFLNKRSIACGPVQKTFTADTIHTTYGKVPARISF